MANSIKIQTFLSKKNKINFYHSCHLFKWCWKIRNNLKIGIRIQKNCLIIRLQRFSKKLNNFQLVIISI